MSTVEMWQVYVTALFGELPARARDDERGDVAQTVVLVGVALVMAAAIAAIIWGKLRDGANDIEVPAPGAP